MWPGPVLTAAHSAANLQLSQRSTAIGQSANSIVLTDLQGRIKSANRAFRETRGYTPAEAPGENPRILKSATTPPALYRELLNSTQHGDDLRESVVISLIRRRHPFAQTADPGDNPTYDRGAQALI